MREKIQEFITKAENNDKTASAVLTWGELSSTEVEFLLAQATQQEDLNLLQAIYHIPGIDSENKIKVLEIVCTQDNLSMETKHGVFQRIEKELDNLYKANEIKKHYLYSGDYYLLRARDKAEGDNLSGLIAKYQQAINCYQKVGADARIAKVEDEIEFVRLKLEEHIQPLPVSLLLSRRSMLEKEINVAQVLLNEIRDQSEKLYKRIAEYQSDEADFLQKRNEYLSEIQELGNGLIAQGEIKTREIQEFSLASDQKTEQQRSFSNTEIQTLQRQLDDLANRKAMYQKEIQEYEKEIIKVRSELAELSQRYAVFRKDINADQTGAALQEQQREIDNLRTEKSE